MSYFSILKNRDEHSVVHWI